jgi:hypothetical protein
MVEQPPKTKKPRGFACLTPEHRRAIASEGGKKAHAMGKRHTFTREEALDAYQKAKATGKLHRFTTEQARIAGRLGGLARSAAKQGKRKA